MMPVTADTRYQDDVSFAVAHDGPRLSFPGRNLAVDEEASDLLGAVAHRDSIAFPVIPDGQRQIFFSDVYAFLAATFLASLKCLSLKHLISSRR